MEILHTEKMGEGVTVEIHQDEDPMNPRREWDNLGTMVCWHRRYNLGDRQIKDGEYASPEAILADIESQEGELAVVLPLYLYDHSGITMSTSTAMFSAIDRDRWDWGQVGFIYVSKAKVREEYGARGTDKDVAERATGCLVGEVATYDQFLTGDCYGYVVKKDGEFLDSCWGFLGHSDEDPYGSALLEGKAAAAHWVKEEQGPQPVLGILS